jgi:putative NIF3 family GTP cyclohydrolase 1 type 2
VVALVPGSGGELLHAAIDAGATCFVTGEMKHHEVLAALDRGCSVLLAGHKQTERPYLSVLASRLETALPGRRALVSAEDRPPAGRAG